MPKVRKKKPRAAPRIQRGAKLKEPSWEGWEEWSGEEVHKHRRHTHAWYYEHFKPADLYTNVPKWMEQDDDFYSKEDIKAAGWEGNINPRYVEVNFNQACNFKCS